MKTRGGRIEVAVTKEIPASADKVWEIVGGFNNLPMFDPLSRWSYLEYGGRDRRIGITGGGELVERLIHFDADERCYSYIVTEIVATALTFTNYFSTVRVIEGENGETCTLDWRGWADPAESATEEDVEMELLDLYGGIANGLHDRFDG